MTNKARNPLLAVSALLVGLNAAPAMASSPDAWSAMRTETADKCLAATRDMFKKARVAVDPTGSTSFSLAILYGKAKGGDNRISVLCIMDKKTKAIEIGTELGQDLVRVRAPKPEGSGSADNEE